MSRTPEERLAILETQMASMTEAVSRIDERTAKLAEAFTMGRGAAWMALKIGGVILGILGGVAWIADHWKSWTQ